MCILLSELNHPARSYLTYESFEAGTSNLRYQKRERPKTRVREDRKREQERTRMRARTKERDIKIL